MGGRTRDPAAQFPQLGPSDPAADLRRRPTGLGPVLMCRHLGWLGEPRSLAALVLDPPYALLVQSYAPRRQKHGLVNADGWGVGFIAGGPRRWRSASPLWAEASFASVAPVLSSGCVVAAVRSATVGMPIEASASAPFTDGEWLLSHNGRVDRDVLPPAPHAESVVDSAQLAAGPGAAHRGRRARCATGATR